MAQARGRHWNEEGSRFDRCKQSAIRLLTEAANEWAEGDPTQPDPEACVEAILAIFIDEHLLKQPYGKSRQ